MDDGTRRLRRHHIVASFIPIGIAIRHSEYRWEESVVRFSLVWFGLVSIVLNKSNKVWITDRVREYVML